MPKYFDHGKLTEKRIKDIWDLVYAISFVKYAKTETAKKCCLLSGHNADLAVTELQKLENE